MQDPVPAAPSGLPKVEVRQPQRATRARTRQRPAAAPAPVETAPATAAVDNRWDRIPFGPDMANNEILAALREKVLAGLWAGEREATALAGQLLIFQAATADRMPQLLKDVGEAYYRWDPKTAYGEDRLRDGLIAWLHNKCEACGVSNSIVVVRPGDRFESSRHNSKQRGVEITAVYGWIVLRDNGKVYTKANVAVK